MLIAAAALTYLTCSVGGDAVQITADEQNQVATVYLPRYKLSNRAAAVYTPNELLIRFGGTSYRVDRTTLAVERTFRLPPARPKVDVGTCQIAEPAERKF